MTAPCHGVAEGEDGSLEEHCVRRALRFRQELKARRATPQVPKECSSKHEGLLLKSRSDAHQGRRPLLKFRRNAP